MTINSKRWLRFVRGLTLSISFLTVATPSMAGDEVPLWSLQITTPKPGCVSNVQFSWEGLTAFNRRGAQPSPRKCNGLPLTLRAGLGFALPKEPLRLTWLDDRGFRLSLALALHEILQDFDVYGGHLDIRLTEGGAEVWLEEPDKSASPDANFWPKKPARMIRAVDASK